MLRMNVRSTGLLTYSTISRQIYHRPKMRLLRFARNDSPEAIIAKFTAVPSGPEPQAVT